MEILTTLTFTNVLADLPNYASGDALDILENYSFISEKLAESFQTVWEGIIFDTTSSFWRAVIAGGLDFALLGMILYAWHGFKLEDEKKRQSYIMNGVVMVIILSILLGGNGLLTSHILRFTHGLDRSLTRTLANTQLLDLSIADSLKNISLTNNARDRVDSLLAECRAMTGNEAVQCLEKQAPEIKRIADSADLFNPLNAPAIKYARNILGYIGKLAVNTVKSDGLAVVAQISNSVITGNPVTMAIIKMIFGAIQLAFNMALEVAGILHALLLPLVIAVSFTPIDPKYVETWITGYVQLVLVKFLYIAVIGLVAEAIVKSETQLATGLGFMMFTSVMGPALAFYMAKGGGAEMAKFVSSQVTSVMSNAVQTGAALATGGASKLGMVAGKGLFSLGGKGLARRTTRRSS